MGSISLITICLNAEKTLRRAVASVLKQTRPPDEYLFVDGGSTDGTLALLDDLRETLEASHIRVTILHQVHREGAAGIPEAWNQGIRAATGDVIAMLNSDDWYAPAALATVDRLFATKPSACLVAVPVRFVQDDGMCVKVSCPKCSCLLPILMPLPHPGLFVRKRVYEQIGNYDERYRISADYDFVWRCHKAAMEIVYGEEPLVSMELGGLANRNRCLARRETRQIACRHGWDKVTPWLAWGLRSMLGR